MNKLSRFLFAAAVAAVLSFSLGPTPAFAQATPYNLNANALAQISGSPGAPVLAPTYAATLALNPNLGIVHQINANSATSATSTVTFGQNGGFGQLMIVIVSATGAGTATITFSGSNLKPTATAAPTTGTSITVAFVSDGAVWHEFARSASAQ